MAMTVELAKFWRVHDAPLSWDKTRANEVLALREGWLEAELPCDAHMPLIAAGVLRDPARADYYRDCDWVEERSWWFLREMDSAEIPACDEALLIFDSLDCCADVFLNGEAIGYQASAHYPFCMDILPLIKPGINTILVRLTCGLERVDDAAPAELGWNVCVEGERRPDRGDMRRAFLRKPQYVFGWDWGPRLATVGIVKGARVECRTRIAVKGAHAFTASIDGAAALVRVEVAVEALPKLETITGSVAVELLYDNRPVVSACAQDKLLTAGLNYVGFELTVPDAKLWWPNGMGAQPLYEVRIEACSGGVRAQYPAFRLGIRTVTLDTSPAENGGRRFRFVVNGMPAFMKGGNWIPSDSIYARVTDARYRALVAEAKEANFNMLRVWGGGLYEADAFYNACDECGILLWHDFMFACSAYPDHRDGFMREVERELDWQTKRLRNHASMALWCGCNENQQIFEGAMRRPGMPLGLSIYNGAAPEAVRRNCPEIPYWPSSPFGGASPNDAAAGDRHIWNDFMMHPDMEKRITPEGYDAVPAMFVSEYGYPGPPARETIEEYFDGRPVERAGEIWDIHNNTFEKDTVIAGIQKHYTEKELGLDEYLTYASLTQALMLGYSLEALRARPLCWGALFWMFNDCWGEVGWSIVDYALRRKPSYYAVKRAFAPVRLIVRKDGGEAVVTLCNDTSAAIRFQADAGWFPLDGRNPRTLRVSVELPAHSRGVVSRLPLAGGDTAGEIWAVRPDEGCGILPSCLRLACRKDMRLPGGRVHTEKAIDDGEDLLITVSSDCFAHAVHFIPGSARASDAYFDLLPRERRTVRIAGMAGHGGEISAVCL